jgi:hypothetical protein
MFVAKMTRTRSGSRVGCLRGAVALKIDQKWMHVAQTCARLEDEDTLLVSIRRWLEDTSDVRHRSG